MLGTGTPCSAQCLGGQAAPCELGHGQFSQLCLGDQHLLALLCLSLGVHLKPTQWVLGTGFPTGWWTALLGRLPSSWGSWRQVLLGSSSTIQTCLGCSLRDSPSGWGSRQSLMLLMEAIQEQFSPHRAPLEISC